MHHPSDLNPYRPPGAESPPDRPAFVWPWLASVSLGLVCVLAAGRMYLTAATSPVGLVVGALLLVVSGTVGRIVAGERGARAITIVTSGAFSLALGMGRIEHVGGELTLWAFSCISAGLLAGAVGPPLPEAPDEPLPHADHPLLAPGEDGGRSDATVSPVPDNSDLRN